jgi:hypothetical protein
MVDDRNRPVVQIFANSEPALVRMHQIAEMAECWIVSARLIEVDADQTAHAAPGASILIELDDETHSEAVFFPLLDWVRREAERGARRAVVSVPTALVDLVAARAWHEEIELLCDADEEDRLTAVEHLVRRPEARVRDSRRERDFPVLQPVDDGVPPPDPAQARADAAAIRRMLRARRLRGHYFRADLFADPAWDMLLDLMAARLEGKKVAVSSLCIAAAVPPTTALRWIGVLAGHGLVVRIADPEDGRRAYIELAEATARALGAWLRQAEQIGVGAV